MLEGEAGPGRYSQKTERFFRCIAGFYPHFRSIRVEEISNALIETLTLVIELFHHPHCHISDSVDGR